MIDCLVSCFRISPHNNQHFKVRALVFIQLYSLMLLILYKCEKTKKMNRLHQYWYCSILYISINFKTLKIYSIFKNFLFVLFFLLFSFVLLNFFFFTEIISYFFLPSVDLPGSEFPFYISLCAGKFPPSNHHQCKSKRYC